MTAPLELFPSRIRFVDENGVLTREAVRALSTLQIRVGGSTAPSTTDLAQTDDDDSGLEEFKAETYKKLDTLFAQPQTVVPPAYVDPMQPLAVPHIAYVDPMYPIAQEHSVIQALLTELSGLREQVTALANQINDIRQGTTL